MKLADLWNKSILILGFGVEGLSTYKLVRELFPRHRIGIADQCQFDELPAEGQELLPSDSDVRLHLGDKYLSDLKGYDVIVKSPGINPRLPEIEWAVRLGKVLTSHTDIFFSNCPGKIIGITGTKGKGTTSKLIHTILRTAGFDSYLVGNIGTPPLPLLKNSKATTYFIYELSAQQLEGLDQSPHISVLLNIVPDHLDHFGTFERYVRAKQNIVAHQNDSDFLIYNPSQPVPSQIAFESKARVVSFSTTSEDAQACISGDEIRFKNKRVIGVEEVLEAIPGKFNLENVLPAVSVAKLLGIDDASIAEGIKKFEGLANRFERVGTYKGITFYNASIATVPEVTISHVKSLGSAVQTMLLGGFDRGVDFSELGRFIALNGIQNLILFPTTGRRILDAVIEAAKKANLPTLPDYFFVEQGSGASAMEEAVAHAYRVTSEGRICIHSPASPSFGLFRNFTERGELFKHFVLKLGSDASTSRQMEDISERKDL